MVELASPKNSVQQQTRPDPSMLQYCILTSFKQCLFSDVLVRSTRNDLDCKAHLSSCFAKDEINFSYKKYPQDYQYQLIQYISRILPYLQHNFQGQNHRLVSLAIEHELEILAQSMMRKRVHNAVFGSKNQSILYSFNMS